MSDIASETHVQRNKIAAKPGRKPKEVWKFFTPIGQKKDGHQSCKCNYCPWSQTRGEPSSMEAHLALSCHKAPIDIKEKFLLMIKSRGENQIINLEEEKSILPIKRKRSYQQSITKYGPVKSVVKSLEFKTTSLSDCFVELIKLSQKIKLLPPVSDYDFKHKCIELFNKRWQEFDINLYLLAYLLHPNYRGKGLLPTVFRNIYLLAMKIWVNMGGGETSSAKLISQIRSFYLRDIEFDYPFSNNEDVITWWRMCNPVPDEENHIQKLALKILSITPHNAGCERVFSILGWFTNKRRTKLKVEKLEAMAKLHTHYIMNAQKELKYAYTGLSEDSFQSSVREALSNAKASDDLNEDSDDDFFDSDDDNDENNDNSNSLDTRSMEIERWINIDDSELNKLLNVNVSVVIEPHPITINHGSNTFDIEATLDSVLN
ncbi:unnamed protein product [Rhizophagus irregularis]|uniref:HAT C-terminal dimerisation domain-containing protein n=2 Tax=Rhizophagus irregularis TaxID=588596 RepID=A0A915YND1_9GLOM|nr:unnamed protein product [Rhizophagus irregularis]